MKCLAVMARSRFWVHAPSKIWNHMKEIYNLDCFDRNFFFFYSLRGGGAPCLSSQAPLLLSQVLWACPQKNLKLHVLTQFFSFFWGGGQAPCLSSQAPLKCPKFCGHAPPQKNVKLIERNGQSRLFWEDFSLSQYSCEIGDFFPLFCGGGHQLDMGGATAPVPPSLLGAPAGNQC